MTEAIQVLAQLSTRGFGPRPSRVLIRAVVIGMAAMYAVLLVGAHPLIASAGLLGGLFFVILRASGPTTYTLTTEGFSRVFTPTWGQRTHEAFYPFEAVRAYRVSRDMSRRLREVESLRIELTRAPRTIVINDQVDPAAFGRFRDAFVEQVERYNVAQGTPAPGADTPHAASPAIRRRKPFYDTVWAKGVTVLFVAVCAGLVYAAFRGHLRETHLWRLGLFVVPGTAYMVWRTFGGPRDDRP